MFKKINEESGWQYNISSITPDELENNSDSEGTSKVKGSEDTEVDADQKLNQQSHRTEADEETEAQLKEKVKGKFNCTNCFQFFKTIVFVLYLT